MARKPPEFVTAQPTETPDPAPAPARLPATGYIVDSSGLPSAGMSAANRPASQRQPIATNQADFRVANNLRHREQKQSNLPIETERSREIKRATDEAVAKQAAARNRTGPAGNGKRWIKLGIQPGERGFTLHVEHFEGDKRVKETVKRGLSPLAAREQLALHMSGMWAGF